MLIFALAILLPIGHNPSLPDYLLQHSAHTLAVGGRQLIVLVKGTRSGQGVAIFHRPIEHVGTRALQAEDAALLGDVLFYKHTQALVAIVYSNGVVLGHCSIVYHLTNLFLHKLWCICHLGSPAAQRSGYQGRRWCHPLCGRASGWN